MNWPAWIVFALFVLVVGYRIWIRRGVEHISVHEIKSRMGAKDRMLMLDVREPHEFKAGHIRGAVNIPLSQLSAAASTLDAKAETLLVCATGNRSISAYHTLKRLGFENVRNVEGGMRRWAWDTSKS